MVKAIRQYRVFLIKEPRDVKGSEIKKNRPAVVVSPIEVIGHVDMVIVAPLTTSVKPFPTRIDVLFNNREQQVVIDQMYAMDKARLGKCVGDLSDGEAMKVAEALQEFFAFVPRK